MEQRHLRAFVEVVRQGSVSRAARVLGRTQPSVSMAVRDLQATLGVRLFERAGRRNQLTPEGRSLMEKAVPLLEEWDALPRRLREGRGTSTVRIGAGEGVTLYLLPDPIRVLRNRVPEVEVIVRNQAAEETLEMLKYGELDFGLRSLWPVP